MKHKFSLRRVSAILSLVIAAALGSTEEIILALDGPTKAERPVISRTKAVGSPGDTVKVVVKNVNPMLFDVKVEAKYTPVFTKPAGVNPWPSAAPNLAGGGVANEDSWKNFISTPNALNKRLLDAERTFEQRGGNYPNFIGDLAKEIKDHTGIEAPVDKSKVEKALAEQMSGTAWNNLSSGDKVAWKAKLEAAGVQILAIATSASKALDPVVATFEMKNDNEITVSVTVTPRKRIAGWDSTAKAWKELDFDDMKFDGFEEAGPFTTTLPLKDSTEINWTFAVFFSTARDKSYALNGTGANQEIVERGDRDQVGVYVGTLYNFPLGKTSDKTYFSIGMGTNAKKLLYFGGLSFRFGSERSPGFLSVGLGISQVEGLDGVAVGPFTGTTIPKKSVYKSSLTIAMSFRF